MLIIAIADVEILAVCLFTMCLIYFNLFTSWHQRLWITNIRLSGRRVELL